MNANIMLVPEYIFHTFTRLHTFYTRLIWAHLI